LFQFVPEPTSHWDWYRRWLCVTLHVGECTTATSSLAEEMSLPARKLVLYWKYVLVFRFHP
jgi:hypothetical protein